MKIALRALGDVHVLAVEGELTPHLVKVVKSGVAKLFSNGKNKIVIELPDVKSFTGEVLRELAILNLFARELSGEVVLSLIDAETMKRVAAFAVPPVVSCFETTEAAVASFKDKAKAKDKAVTRPAAPKAVPTPPEAVKEKVGAPVEPAKAEESLTAELSGEALKAIEAGEVGRLRKELEASRRENLLLKEQLSAWVVARREPQDVGAYQEKVRGLEAQLEKVLAQAGEKG